MARRVGKYIIQKTLGEGSLGKVKLSEDSETHELVAIKMFDKEKVKKQNMAEQIKLEISIMNQLKHPNLVNLIEVLGCKSKIFMVLEYVPNGELFDYILKKGKLSEEEARKFFRELVTGVAYIHSHNICHRDIKPENLLLDKNMSIKISDFGLSAFIGDNIYDSNSLQHTTCGSPNYVAPEVLKDSGYNGRFSDIWSIGVVLFVMVAGYLPFDEPSLSTLFRRIQAANYTCPVWFSEDLKDLLSKILVPDPTKRTSLYEISRHPWYLGSDLQPDMTSAIPPEVERSLPCDPKITECKEDASRFVAPEGSIFTLLRLSIQSSIYPISTLLAPGLPCNVVLTPATPDSILDVIIAACKDQNWGVTCDRKAGKVFIAMKIVDFLSSVEIHVNRIGEKLYMICVLKKDDHDLDGYLQVERNFISRLIRCLPGSQDIGLNNRGLHISKS